MHAAFTDIHNDRTNLRNVLERMEIYEEGDDLDVEPLAGGVSSNVLKVSTGRRVFCLKQALPKLKVAKEWHAPVDRIFSEIDWLKTVEAIVPDAVPRIYGVDRETGCFAMQFLSEVDHPNWKTQLLAGELRDDIATALGDTLGRIHAATADRQDMAATFASDDNFHALRLEPYLAETAAAHPALSRRLLAILEQTANTRRALVHGDVSPKNILVGPGGPVILDAECAWYGDPAFDLAFCLNHFLLKASLFPERTGGYLRLFECMVNSYFAHVRWEPREDLEARVATLLPCLTLARVDGKSPVEYLNDNQRMRVRTLTERMIHTGSPSLVELRLAWSKGMQE